VSTRNPNYGQVNNNLAFKETQHVTAINFASHDASTVVFMKC